MKSTTMQATRSSRRTRTALVLAAAMAMAAPAVHAQESYPSRAVRVVVAFPPGGATDLLGRTLADGLSKRLGQTFVVDNRAGASGNIGTAQVAQAKPDGYTLLVGTIATQSVNNHLYKTPGFDALTDFTPISLVAEMPNLVVVNPALPVKSLAEFIAYAKSNPGKLNYGSTGAGGSPYLVMELMKASYGLDIVHVAFKGSAPIQQALIAGTVQVAADNLTTALPQAKAGNTRALAVTSAQRSPAAPDIPAVSEAGSPDLVMTAWFAFVGPANLPKAVTTRLSDAAQDVLKDPATIDRLRNLGAIAHGSTPEWLADHIRKEYQRWGDLLRRLNVPRE